MVCSYIGHHVSRHESALLRQPPPNLHRSLSFGTINLHRTLPSSQPRGSRHVAHASVCRRKEGLGPRCP